MIRKFISYATGWRIGTAQKNIENVIAFMAVVLLLTLTFYPLCNVNLTYAINTTSNEIPMAHCSAACVPMEEKRSLSSDASRKIGIDMFPFNKDEMILPISSSVKTVILIALKSCHP